VTPEQATAVLVQNGIVSTTEVRRDPKSIEQQQRDQDLLAYRVLGELMGRVPIGIRIGGWNIGSGSIDVHVRGFGLSDHEIRGRVMQLAEQFSLDYAEYPLGGSPSQNRVSACGDYQGVSVRFWYLVSPCSCEDCGAAR